MQGAGVHSAAVVVVVDVHPHSHPEKINNLKY